jgi:hypothetical protein
LAITTCIFKAAAAITTFTSPIISITGGSATLQGLTLGLSTRSSGDCAGILASGFSHFELSGDSLMGDFFLYLRMPWQVMEMEGGCISHK